jgi:hypothetical protein
VSDVNGVENQFAGSPAADALPAGVTAEQPNSNGTTVPGADSAAGTGTPGAGAAPDTYLDELLADIPADQREQAIPRQRFDQVYGELRDLRPIKSEYDEYKFLIDAAKQMGGPAALQQAIQQSQQAQEQQARDARRKEATGKVDNWVNNGDLHPDVADEIKKALEVAADLQPLRDQIEQQQWERNVTESVGIIKAEYGDMDEAAVRRILIETGDENLAVSLAESSHNRAIALRSQYAAQSAQRAAAPTPEGSNAAGSGPATRTPIPDPATDRAGYEAYRKAALKNVSGLSTASQ